MSGMNLVSETDFQKTIIDAAHTFGWLVAHFRAARVMKHGVETWRTAVSADGKGFPDLLMIKDKRLMVVETKSNTGRLSKEQGDWLRAFANCKVEWHVWTPMDDFEEIARILQRDDHC